MVRPRDVALLGIGALISPIAYEITFRLLGRHSLDPTQRSTR